MLRGASDRSLPASTHQEAWAFWPRLRFQRLASLQTVTQNRFLCGSGTDSHGGVSEACPHGVHGSHIT